MKERKNFTIYGSNIDKKINSKLDVFIETLKSTEFFKEIESIYITGSYARGEGGVKISKGKAVDSSSDFDTYIVTKNKIGNSDLIKFVKEIKKLAKESKLNFMIDLHYSSKVTFLNANELSKILPVFRFYNLKHHSKLIFGKDVRKNMPNFSSKDLPLYEGLRLLLNRLFELADSFDSKVFDSKNLTKYDKLKLSKNVCKLYVFSIEALSILSRNFSYNYDLILKKISKGEFDLKSKIPDYCTKVISSLEQIKTSKYNTKNVVELYINSIKDTLILIEVYSFNAYGEVFNSKSKERVLSKISEKIMLPYYEWHFRKNYGMKIPLVSKVSLLQRVYQNSNFLRQFKEKIPYKFSYNIDTGIKIYYFGLCVFDEYVSNPQKNKNYKKIELFAKLFTQYFKKLPEYREIVFGDPDKEESHNRKYA